MGHLAAFLPASASLLQAAGKEPCGPGPEHAPAASSTPARPSPAKTAGFQASTAGPDGGLPTRTAALPALAARHSPPPPQSPHWEPPEAAALPTQATPSSYFSPLPTFPPTPPATLPPPPPLLSPPPARPAPFPRACTEDHSWIAVRRCVHRPDAPQKVSIFSPPRVLAPAPNPVPNPGVRGPGAAMLKGTPGRSRPQAQLLDPTKVWT